MNKVPDPGEGFRYKGAHLAMSVGSLEEYDEVYSRLEASGAYLEGDLRAAHRKPGEKSVYLYDPFGNRLQLIILPPARDKAQAADIDHVGVSPLPDSDGGLASGQPAAASFVRHSACLCTVVEISNLLSKKCLRRIHRDSPAQFTVEV